MKRRPSRNSRIASSQPPPLRLAVLLLGLAWNGSSTVTAAAADSSPAAPLDCDTDCGKNRIQICHFNGHSYQTLCIRRNSALRQRRRRRPSSSLTQQEDYCGPCTSKTKAFDSPQELKDAVQQYVSADVYDVALADTYGWPLSQWNVSLVDDFSHLFDDKHTLSPTESLEGWDVSRATDLSFMFRGCPQFDGNSLRDWNVAKVETFEGMFHGATHFDGNLQHWQTHSATTMKRMFQDATHFNQPIGSWDVSQVVDTSHMFAHAQALDQDLRQWNMEAALDVSYMFYQSHSFSHDLSPWKLSSVGAMHHMLAGVPATPSQQTALVDAWKAQMGTSNILARVTLRDIFGTPPRLPSWPTPSPLVLRGQKTTHNHVHLSRGQPTLEDHPLPSTLLHRELPPWSTHVHRHTTTTTTDREERNETYRNHDDEEALLSNDKQQQQPYPYKCREGFCDNTIVTTV